MATLRPRLIILAGIPGCGKSTWARRFFPNSAIVSSDEIRAELYDGDYDPERNGEVFALFHDKLTARLEHLGVAVADSTALSKDARERLLAVARSMDAEVHLVLFTNTAQAWENNVKREPRWVVPTPAMEHMVEKYMSAKWDVKDEGYDSITYVEGVESTLASFLANA